MKKFWIIPLMGFLTDVSIGSVGLPSSFNMGNMPMERVCLLPYSPVWASIYKKEASDIASALGSRRVISIQHFGSTSIPGMIAKPIIDIIVGLNEFRLDELEKNALGALGYKLIEESNYCQRFYLHKRGSENVNLSLTTHKSSTWNDCIAIRDYLREHPEERNAYIDVKIRALLENKRDIYQYSSYKRDFVKKLSDRARAWRSDE